MEGDESRRISKLEWSVSDMERQIAALSEKQRRAEETISKLSATVEALVAARKAQGNDND